jgi:hypothetical protein
MKELLRGESTISLEAAVLKCPNAELYPFLRKEYSYTSTSPMGLHGLFYGELYLYL